MKALKSFVLIAVLGSAVGVASTVSAQVADHLKCYKVKDLRGQTNVHYTLTLTPSLGAPFTVETGCQVQAAARNLCVPVVKSAVTPAPFPVGPGAAAQTYV